MSDFKEVEKRLGSTILGEIRGTAISKQNAITAKDNIIKIIRKEIKQARIEGAKQIHDNLLKIKRMRRGIVNYERNYKIGWHECNESWIRHIKQALLELEKEGVNE